MLQRISILFFICFCSFGYASADIINDTRDDISDIQGMVPSGIPTPLGGYAQKGYVGEIISNIFDGTQYIRSEFISAFRSIFNSSVNNIPKWNGQSFSQSNIWEVGGKVGIDVINPGKSLSVGGEASFLVNDPNGNGLYIDTYTGSLDTGPAIKAGGSNTVYLRPYGANNLSIMATGPGKVGIGTDTPTTKLNVIGKVGATEYCDKDGNNCFVSTDVGAGGADNLGNHVATQNVQLNNNWLSNDGGDEGIYILNNGRVGIGNNNPETQLHVTNVGRFDGGVQIDGNVAIEANNRLHIARSNLSDYGGFLVKNNAGDNGAYFGLGNGNDRVTLSLQKADKLWITGGNVGIGVQSPNDILDVGGNIRITGSVPRIRLQDSDTPNANMEIINSDGKLIIRDQNAAFTGSSAPTIAVTQDGNVGIGLFTPNLAKLDVNGKIRMRTQTSTGDTVDIVATKGYVDTAIAGIPSGGAGDNLGNHRATQDIDAGNFRIMNLAEPTRNANAATKLYVDTAISRISNWTNPPVCNGNDKALGWNGNSWTCNNIGTGTPPTTYYWSTGAWGSCEQIRNRNCIKIMGKTRTVQCISSAGAISIDSKCTGSKPSGVDEGACWDDDLNCGP